ncbi:Vesicle-fusing ATPase [Camellia lanceoleosa]|uniref:Vesicle-fusing ATPase n=1 Tax=Camellia lanceoleosa TaxID=1840588 RepID=A0ACC0HQD4_9ERIC|nr:Vesicle-fusing ATPase [Camellia lanceoleosa]
MGQNYMDDRLVNQLLTMVDGMKVLNNIFIIATTNRKELIDEALLREGRIELHVKVEYPDKQGHLQILDINTRNMRQAFLLDEDVNLQEIDGCSGSALASLVTRAHSYAVVQAGDRGLGKHVEKDIEVTMNHFIRAIEEVKSRLQESSLEPSRMGMEEMFPRQLSSTNSTDNKKLQGSRKTLHISRGAMAGDNSLFSLPYRPGGSLKWWSKPCKFLVYIWFYQNM